MEITIDLCTYSTNPDGKRLLRTLVMSYHTVTVTNKDEARTYAKGVVCGLSLKWTKPAVRIFYEDGTTEDITNCENHKNITICQTDSTPAK